MTLPDQQQICSGVLAKEVARWQTGFASLTLRDTKMTRRCLREPIPEIFEAATLLQRATSAHLKGSLEEADALIRAADIPLVASWTESVWGKANARRNNEQHAAFQCMWLQFDHILPNQRGGASEAGNVLVTCAPCNFRRMERTCAEARLSDPRDRMPAASWPGYSRWDGLASMLPKPYK